jgi:galactokinase
MPVAIGFSTWIKVFPSSERKIEIYSENFNEQVVFDLDKPQTTARGHWSDYPIGVASMFLRAGHYLRGARLVIKGEVPIGSGLSSSARLKLLRL